jgi:DNA-binding GntR family transcriptional regulator
MTDDDMSRRAGPGFGATTPELLSSAKGREAYFALQAGIQTGRYPPGTRLKEVDLAAELGMSRTPIREAIRQLERDGAVEVVPNRGATVREWSADDVDDAYELRAVLEGFCASRAAVRMDEVSCIHLVELHAEFERQLALEPPPIETLIRLNAAFHRAIVEGSGNVRAGQILPNATEVSRDLKHAFWGSQRAREITLVYHREIVSAIRAHDAVRAEAVMRSHVFAVKDFYSEYQRSERIQRLLHAPVG